MDVFYIFPLSPWRQASVLLDFQPRESQFVMGTDHMTDRAIKGRSWRMLIMESRVRDTWFVHFGIHPSSSESTSFPIQGLSFLYPYNTKCIWNICILHDRSFAYKRILHGSRKLLLETYLLVTYGRSITYLMVGPHVLANSSQFSYTPHKINERGNVRKGY